ncbi:single-stranded DNA-binding protein [Candidatus Daviesbacteria bacterium]|nr:single-stranded DNA-binding protein [Candidatus Daviesbacteria bacterium]
MGNLTRDPELRYTPNGAAVCTFGLATNRSYVSDGERKEEVDFHNCVAWNKLAELCNQLLKKGVKVFVSGRLQYREWEGTDGQKKQRTEIVIADMVVLSGSKTVSGGEELSSEDVTLTASVEPKAVADVAPAESEVETPKDEKTKPEKEEPKKSASEDISPDDLPF